MYIDPDGNKVPVPYGFTVSGAESEKYVNHNVEIKGTLSELTWSSSGDYPWTQNSDGIWQSGNYRIKNTESELISNEIIIGGEGGQLSVQLSVSCNTTNHAISMEVDVINVETNAIIKSSGKMCGDDAGTNYNSLKYTNYIVELSEGIYKVKVLFHVTSAAFFSNGLDRGYIKGGTVFNFDTHGTDLTTVHQLGGVVIYEGSTPVTNENALQESIIRNQFVWIPVADSSRICTVDVKTHKKKSCLYNIAPTGMYLRTNNNLDTKSEPGIHNDDHIRRFTQTNLQGYEKDSYYKEIELDFNNTINSIEKYGRILCWKI